MAFSSFSEFLFMTLIDSWHVPRSGYTLVWCLAKNSVTIRLECDGALSLSGGDALHTQNMNHNVLNRSIRDVESLCYLSNANTTIFEYNWLHFFDVIVVNIGGWTS